MTRNKLNKFLNYQISQDAHTKIRDYFTIVFITNYWHCIKYVTDIGANFFQVIRQRV